jgi:hypothetical protein
VVVRHEIALLVDVEPVAEHVGVRAVADRDEQALDRAARSLAGLGVAEPRPSTFASPRTSSTAVFVWTSILGCS